ncbi:glutamate racemase [Moorena producens JHB]|uniref:Glutamate racemase n=1 Tax=Moorena producens (strain JHB) TaxID=1454205 RepID=A0A1D9G248_MOOP1|nr:glutamate racemase [Moorena producens]AOY81697.1 glutamate racemase [Moorena producens JHB]
MINNQILISQTQPQSRPIGIFDSGVGGLTVLRELYKQLPSESIIYFADTARLPYGTRSADEIVQFGFEILSWMVRQEVKMVVMACNTSSALALETLRSEFDIPMLGLILPGARAAVHQGRRIGVIATPATAASNAYRNAILEVEPTAQVWQVGCPEFVPLVEQNRLYEPYTTAVARQYLEPLLTAQIDTLVYGCTHYPHLEPILREILPPDVQLVDPAKYVVAAAAQELDLIGGRNTGEPNPTRFGVSGCPQQFAQQSLQWLGYTPTVEKIHLPQVSIPRIPLGATRDGEQSLAITESAPLESVD